MTNERLRHATFSCNSFWNEECYSISKTAYSKMKYGSKTVARDFGIELAEAFIDYLKIQIDTEDHKNSKFAQAFRKRQIVVIPSPYDFIPTATFAIKDYFITELNDYLVEQGLSPVQETKVHRTRGYNEDYGLMSAEEREKAISGDGFHVDAEFLKGKFVIFLDDVRISGGHERRMEQMVRAHDLNCDYMYMYYGELMGENPDPTIEHHFNHFAINDLWDIDSIIKNEEFLFNTRVVKYILSASEIEFCLFISSQSDVFKKTLNFYLTGNRYHEMDEFTTNINHLKQGTYLQFVKSLSTKL